MQCDVCKKETSPGNWVGFTFQHREVYKILCENCSDWIICIAIGRESDHVPPPPLAH
jgi:hypothetical protein